MENTTKALLIAAAVLIAIVIIALVMILIRNSDNSAAQIDQAGATISDSADEAVRNVQKTYISSEKFNDFINDFNKKYKTHMDVQKQLNSQNIKIRTQIALEGFIFKGGQPELTDYLYYTDDYKTYKDYFKEKIYTKLHNSGNLIKVSNPSTDGLKEVLKRYYKDMKYTKDKKDYSSYEEFCNAYSIHSSFFFAYDNDGYIYNILCYICSKKIDKVVDCLCLFSFMIY